MTLDFPEEVLKEIQEAELLRHLFVHAGGRVTADYLKRSGRTDVELGTQLGASKEFAMRVSWSLILLAGEVVADIGRVHFGKGTTPPAGVWRRARSDAELAKVDEINRRVAGVTP